MIRAQGLTLARGSRALIREATFDIPPGARTGVVGRILRKADDPWTWIEIYEDVTDGDAFVLALEEAVERHALNRFVDDGGSRHVERFVACA